MRPTWGWTTRAETTLPQSRRPPPNSTCPLILNPPSPPPVPAPLLHSQLSHSHTLLSLSCCVCQSLSPSTSSKWPELLSSLLSSLHLSTTLSLPPPVVRLTSAPVHIYQVKRISGCYTFPKVFIFILDFFYLFFLFFWEGALTLLLWSGRLVCVWRVCEGSGVVFFALREPLKVVTDGETFSPR